MVKAFERFNEIQKLETAAEKHKAWLQDYKGLAFSVAEDGIDKIKWKDKQYVYKSFSPEINKIQRHPRRLVLEFDDHTNGEKDKEKAKKNIEFLREEFVKRNWGFIESSHQGNSNYLWVEFTRNITDEEAETFTKFVATFIPTSCEIDLNFTNSNYRLPILFARHWKHSKHRELPVSFFEGEQIDFDSLGLKVKEKKKKKYPQDIQPSQPEDEKYSTHITTPPPTPEQIEEAKVLLGKSYELAKEIINFYIDLPDEQVEITALWIIGTYFYNKFEAYPYLFFNAMRGSGKTRMLKIITSMADEGKLVASLTESVMFRSKGTLGIDEFESLASKDKQALRELLNASYKKGIKIQRMRKKKTFAGEEQVIEEFEPYKPIVMANIWGIEEVLSDRCITLVLEKSNQSEQTKLIEDFSNNLLIQAFKANLKLVKCRMCDVGMSGGLYRRWNLWVKHKYATHTYIDTLPTLNTQTPSDLEEDELFLKIDSTNLNGRHLELFFPLFLLAKEIGSPTLNKVLEIATKLVKDKRIDELVESKDITLIEFISKQDKDWVVIKQLTTMFRNYTHDEEGENAWINPTWVGRALKRLNLILEKRRLSDGVQVILNIDKAKTKMEMFK
jgi:hypothetical protein